MSRRKAGLAVGVWVFFLLIAVFGAVLNVPLVRGSGTIYIRADGSIDPPAAPIQRDGDVYTFTDNIYDSIVVERSNIKIDGNGYTLQGVGSETGFVLWTGSVTIQNTTIKRFDKGIHIHSSSNITVWGSTLTGNNVGVYIGWSSYNSILGNKIANNYTGVQLWHSSHNNVSSNNITNNWDGVRFDDASSNNMLSNNNIRNNHHGIWVSASSENKIIGNNITENDDGVFLLDSFNNTLNDNHIINHFFFYGVHLYNSSKNTLIGNHIRNNGVGIHFTNSTDNIIFHNDFINIREEASFFRTGYVNIWDDGYPSGGNYWSDYNGADLSSGPYQNLTGSDGIGDIPYVIDAHNRDLYPLMKPCVVPDMASPITTHDYDGLWHTSDFAIGLTATDDITGVAETYYKINNGPTKNVTTDGQPWFTTESTNNTLEYWSVDKARNEEFPHKILTGIKLDKTRPTAAFITSPIQVFDQRRANVGAIVTFNATASNDNIGIVSYEWNFGDGTTKTGITANHTYTSLGNYTVTLTVKDAAEHADTWSITIMVVSAETFLMWMVGAAVAIIAIAAAVTAVFWRKRKQPLAKGKQEPDFVSFLFSKLVRLFGVRN